MTPPRVRFAPSPTGYLHVGGARTALFNWLYRPAHRRHLRAPDRGHRPGAQHRGAHPGHPRRARAGSGSTGTRGPSSRARTAPATGPTPSGCWPRARPTAASAPARSSTRSAPGRGRRAAAFRYDRRCDRLSPAESRAPARAPARRSPSASCVPDEEIAWDDAVHGRISFQGRDLDDFVILRSDGTPIYNLAVVSDDIAMRITHVMRGDDHISNTPEADRALPGARARAAGLRPRADDPRHRRQEALEAARRHRRGRLPGPGHPPGRHAELPRPARLVARRRPRDPARGGDDRSSSRSRASRRSPRCSTRPSSSG